MIYRDNSKGSAAVAIATSVDFNPYNVFKRRVHQLEARGVARAEQQA